MRSWRSLLFLPYLVIIIGVPVAILTSVTITWRSALLAGLGLVVAGVPGGLIGGTLMSRYLRGDRDRTRRQLNPLFANPAETESRESDKKQLSLTFPLTSHKRPRHGAVLLACLQRYE